MPKSACTEIVRGKAAHFVSGVISQTGADDKATAQRVIDRVSFQRYAG